MILGLTVTSQVVFNGLVQGVVYGVLAMAIVLVYRTSTRSSTSPSATWASSAPGCS